VGKVSEPADLLAILLGLAVAIGCINHLWIGLPPAIGMLLGSLALSACVVSSDHLLHLHGMRWFRGTFATENLPRFFLDGVLALLLFAGSLHVDAKQLGQRRFLISLLVTTSVILSTLIFGTWHVADFRSDRRDRSACVVLCPQRYPRSYRRGGCRKSPAAGEPAGAPARRSSARAFLMTAPASYYSSSRSG
jgi:hypothetical protein